MIIETTGQDGGVNKHILPPCTTTAKIQLDYKTNFTQICQKIYLYGSLTTKDSKKPHSSRMGRRSRDAVGHTGV